MNKKYTTKNVELVKYEEVDNGSLFIDNGSLFIDNGYLLEKEDEQFSTPIKQLGYWETDEWVEGETDEWILENALDSGSQLGYGDSTKDVYVWKIKD